MRQKRQLAVASCMIESVSIGGRAGVKGMDCQFGVSARNAGGGARATRTLATLVEADYEDGAFGSCRFGGEFLGALVVVVEDADADPPVSGGAGEAEDVGRVIAAFEVIGEFGGGGFVGESADLDGPFSGRGGRCGGLHQLDFHFRDAGLPDVDFLGGGEGEIDDSSGNERAAVGDAEERSRAR